MSHLNDKFPDPQSTLRHVFRNVDPVGKAIAGHKGANFDPYHLYNDPVEPDTTTPTPVTPMPIPGQDDLSNIAARRRSVEEQLRRRGRMSTVLSNPQAEPLGG